MSATIHPIDERYQGYLRDESGRVGQADSISFPASESDIIRTIGALKASQTAITIQGSRTGVRGQAVSRGGHLLNLSRMSRETGMARRSNGKMLLRVQPGMPLETLNRRLTTRQLDTTGWDRQALAAYAAFRAKPRLFWPPDPTEQSASIGGIAAGNSRGPCAHHYGPARRHVEGIGVVDADGRSENIGRGEYVLTAGDCRLPAGRHIHVDEGLLGPDEAVDLLDLHLGSNGRLGVISELGLRLQPMPAQMIGITFFFTQPRQAVDFVDSLLAQPPAQLSSTMVAIELLDQRTLDCIARYRSVSGALASFPAINRRLTTLITIEIHARSEAAVDALAQGLLERGMAHECDTESLWAFAGEIEIARLRRLRHAAPESVNWMIDRMRREDPRIGRLSATLDLPGRSLANLLSGIEQDLNAAGLEAAIFGHAGDNCLYVNLLPTDHVQFESGQDLLHAWEDRLFRSKANATVTAKARRRAALVELLKPILDPENRWNPGHRPLPVAVGKSTRT